VAAATVAVAANRWRRLSCYTDSIKNVKFVHCGVWRVIRFSLMPDTPVTK